MICISLRKRRIFVCKLLLIAYVITGSKNINGGDIKVNSFLSAEEKYSDRKEDFVTTMTPALQFIYSAEKLNSKANLSLGIRKHSKYTDSDSYTHNYSLQNTYRLTPKLNVNFGGKYSIDEMLDSELETTGILTGDDQKKTSAVNLGVSYSLSEVLSVSGNMGYSETVYEGSKYKANRSKGISLNIKRMFNEGIYSVSLSPYYRNYELSDGDSNTKGVSAALAYNFDETLQTSVNLGYRNTESEHGWTSDISLKKSFQKSSFQLGFNRDIAVTAANDIINKESFYINTGYNFTEKFSAGISGTYLTSKSDGDVSITDSEFYKISPSLTYKYSENTTFRFSYSHSFTRDNEQDDEVQENSVYFSVNLTWPLVKKGYI